MVLSRVIQHGRNGDGSYKRSLTIVPRLKRAFLILSFFVCYEPSLGQNKAVVDSLNIILGEKTGPSRWEPLYELVFEFIGNDDDKAMSILDEALTIAPLTGDSLKMVKSMRLKGQLMGKANRTVDQMAIFQKALPIAFRNGYKRECAFILHGIANVYIFYGLFDKALEHHLKALQLKKVERDTSEIALSMHNIGLLYYKMGDSRKAINYYQESLRLRRSIGEDSKTITRLLLNMSLCYSNLKSFDEAEKCIQEAYKGCGDKCLPLHALDFFFSQGTLDFFRNNLVNAEVNFTKSYAAAGESKNVRLQFACLNALAEIKIKQAMFKDAMELFDKAERLAAENSNLIHERLELYSVNARLHSIRQNYEKLVHYQSMYSELKDSLYNFKFSSEMVEIEKKFIEEEYSQIHSSQTQMLSLKDKIVKQQKQITYTFSALLIILFLTIFFLFLNNRKFRNFEVLLKERINFRRNHLSGCIEELIKYNPVHGGQINDLIFETKNDVKSIINSIDIQKVKSETKNNQDFHQYVDEISKALRSLLSFVNHFEHKVQRNDLDINQ